LRSKRQQLHMRIGVAMEERFAETAETKPELLSHHFREAGLPARAIPYAIRAGDLAAARYASAEARVRYGDALAMARALPPSDEAARAQIQAVLKLASVALNRAHFEADLEDLAIVEPLAEALEDRPALCQIRYWTGRLNYVLGRFDLGVEYATQALQMADALGAGDDITAPPVNLLARLHCLRGEPRAAVLQARRNVAQMRAIGNAIEEAAVSGVLAFAYGLHGEFENAFAAAESGVKLAEGIDHLPTLAACLHFRGVVRGWHGDLDEAVPSFEDAIAVADRAGDVFRKYLAYGWRGEAYVQAGWVLEAEADLLRCLELGDQIGTSFHRSAFQAFLAKIRLREGATDEALRLADQAVQLAIDTAQAWSGSIAQRVRAEALLAAEPPALDAAEQAIREAIRVQEERECRCDLAWSTLVLGRVLAARGDPTGAGQAYAASEALLDGMGMAQLASAATVS
jgi:tetratricopeptide (TPR) repeat protein